MKLQPPRRIELEIPSPESVRSLCGGPPKPRISLYLTLPRDPSFDEIRQLPQRYERAVDAAEERAGELSIGEEDRRALLEPLREVTVELADLPPLARGLAIFGTPDGVRAFVLPVNAPDAVRVGRGLHLRPLLAAARLEGRFRVLALSTNHVALFEGDARGLRRIEGEGVPASLEDALGTELTSPQLQLHSTATDGGAAVFHGHGGASAGRSADRERFHRVLAQRVATLWNQRDDPLVLAADESHQGRFRKTASLPGMIEAGIAGNTERMRISELFERARALVLEERVAADRAAARRAADALARGAAVGTFETALAAAVAGRVLRLWLAPDARVAKHVEPDTGRLVEAWGDEDALDELADVVLARGGYALVDTAQVTGREVVAELRG